MGRVVKMLDSINRSPVKYLEFTRIFSKKPKAAICFFEGEDIKYYGIRIQNFSNKCEWFPIECKGKKDVLDLYHSIRQHIEYKKANVLFFIDKDFDEPINIKNKYIYETPCYSIENFYVTVACFSRILESEFKLTEFCDSSECYFNCMKNFISRQKQFHRSVKYLNSWIKTHRKNKSGSLKSKKLNLNNVSINNLVTISLNGITKKYKNKNLSTLFESTLKLSNEEINIARDSFDNNNLAYEFRGKYEAEFMRIFLIKLSEDRNNAKPKFFREKGNVKLNISAKNFLSDLSQYAETPDCLIIFLKRFFIALYKKQTLH